MRGEETGVEIKKEGKFKVIVLCNRRLHVADNGNKHDGRG